ncbi:hypothetical protein GCM10011588_06280 [Nocardia jinanensis]|uniref:Uncharacterized protein n=2 Tax=Nocardia jinanensis TaxID=382504 RepID=A0A917VM25_9NOCA|nr:hypothetical protein GCM10011588_06280 [Nocardia jinanensis]
MDRKFDGPPDVFFGSPFIAVVQHRLLDMIAEADPAKEQDWHRWRQAEHHPHRVKQVRNYLQGVKGWPTMTADTRRQFVRDLFAPLLPSEDLLEELMGHES